MSKICILDYGFGNVTSLSNSLKFIGYDVDFYSENKNKKYDLIFIPGVGSFAHASKKLENPEIKKFLFEINNNSIFFGICLGMQLMTTFGTENGENNGLNFINGCVKKLPNNLVLPVIGWKKTNFIKHKILNQYNDTKFYYVHSYVVNEIKDEVILSKTKYEDISYISSFHIKKYFGTQFHPEKSGENGLNFLKDVLNFYSI